MATNWVDENLYRIWIGISTSNVANVCDVLALNIGKAIDTVRKNGFSDDGDFSIVKIELISSDIQRKPKL